MLPSGSSDQPEDIGRAPQASSYSVLLRVGFAQPTSHLAAGELLPHHFTLARPLLVTRDERCVSVALSVGLPLLGVTQHPARRSSDFPRYVSNIARSPDLLAPNPVYSREIRKSSFIPRTVFGCNCCTGPVHLTWLFAIGLWAALCDTPGIFLAPPWLQLAPLLTSFAHTDYGSPH